MINDEWLQKQYNGTGENAPDNYVLGILDCGKKLLELIEAAPIDQPLDANELVLQADRELKMGITGNMAAYVALIGVKCHSRGEEFRKSWNAHHGRPDSTGVVNPAVITLKN